MDNFKIANLIVQWDGGDFMLATGKYMERFRCEAVSSCEKIQFKARFAELKYYTNFPLITENRVYALFDVNGEYMLTYHWGSRRFAFAVWPERIGIRNINECWFDPDMLRQPGLNADWFFGIAGLHKALLLHGAVVLHASYIDWNGRAILFTAPSGTGKSTQAFLWKEYAGTGIINGDRALLRQLNGRWHAFGYPCCGSSKICLNRTLPLQAIVILQQGFENRIEQLSSSEKIRSLTAAIEVYPWDISEINRAFETAENLIQKVMVIRMVCLPNADAVYTLQKYLEDGNHATDI